MGERKARKPAARQRWERMMDSSNYSYITILEAVWTISHAFKLTNPQPRTAKCESETTKSKQKSRTTQRKPSLP